MISFVFSSTSGPSGAAGSPDCFQYSVHSVYCLLIPGRITSCSLSSGYVLPSTGGMGTVPFAAVGGMLTVGAALLLAKRKKHEEKGE